MDIFNEMHAKQYSFSFYVLFGVLTAVVMKSSVFRDITPCSPLRVNGRFGGTCLHLQGRNQHEAANNHSSSWYLRHAGFLLA
jgi:hypothetical protein